MKKLTLTLCLTITLLLGSMEIANSNDLIRSLTNGECSTTDCMNTYTIRSLTNGECSTTDCMNTYNIRSLTNGECSTTDCMNTYNIRSLTNGECSTNDCLRKHTNKSLGLPENYRGSYGGGGRGYDYDVSGSGDTGDVTGSIDATSGSRDVDGYITLEDGREVSFEGEWVGKGEIEGYDEDGNYYELEVD
jgi:hypothetical protein